MTPQAQTVVDVAGAFGKWVSTHVVSIGAVVTATLPILQILKAIQLTTDELAGLQLGIGAIVAAITGQKTVSKVRMDERVEEKVAVEVERRMGTGDGAAL